MLSFAVLPYDQRLNNAIEILSWSIPYSFPFIYKHERKKYMYCVLKVTGPSSVHVLSLSLWYYGKAFVQ
jgi:hypothetical protein